MKNLILTIVFCVTYQFGTAQNYIPVIKNNTELNYICKLHGQTRTLSLTSKFDKDTLVFDLNTRGVKSSIVTMPEALKSGNELSYNQGEFSDILVLKPTETFFMISQDSYKELLENDKFIYNNTTYVLDTSEIENGLTLEGKLVDALHVIAQIDETEMWIIRNPDFPMICKMIKNPLGINYTLVKINYKE